MTPKFFVKEDWDNSGNVTIYFEDKISPELRTHVVNELAEVLPKLSKSERDEYHLERIVGGIFVKALVNGEIEKDTNKNHWTVAGSFKCQKSI